MKQGGLTSAIFQTYSKLHFLQTEGNLAQLHLEAETIPQTARSQAYRRTMLILQGLIVLGDNEGNTPSLELKVINGLPS